MLGLYSTVEPSTPVFPYPVKDVYDGLAVGLSLFVYFDKGLRDKLAAGKLL